MSEAVELKAETVCAALTGVLARYLGETMARSSVRVHSEQLGLKDRIDRPQAEALIAKVGNGLNVFVGREKAAHIITEMKQTLIRTGGDQ